MDGGRKVAPVQSSLGDGGVKIQVGLGIWYTNFHLVVGVR